MRAVIEYEEKDNVLCVKELPYGVYTNTISEQIQKLLEEQPNCGIEKINDGSGKTPDYLIYLSKKASVSKVLKLLYKYTSLQSFYSINMNMLDEGRYPKTFGWKEALQAHLDHEKVVYRRGFEYDLQKVLDRLHIISALLKAIANIDEVVHTIKSSSNTIAANKALRELLNIDEIQAKAILDIKLARLAHMEIDKLKNEEVELELEKDKIEAILASEDLLNKEIEKGLKKVSDRFGDARRTQILSIEKEEDEIKEVEDLMVSITSSNNFYVNTTSSLYTSGRRTKGEKIKGTAKDEYVIDTSVGNNKNDFLLFSDKGKVYKFNFAKCETKTITSFFEMIRLDNEENIVRIKNVDKSADFVVFTTHNGYIKKSSINEYNNITKRGIIAIKLEPNDYIVGIDFVKDEPIAIITTNGYFVLRDTLSVRPTGRATRGIKAVNLKENDKIAAAHKMFKGGKEVMTLTSEGKCNRVSIDEYEISSNAIRGKKIITLGGDKVTDFVMIRPNQNEVIITYKKTQNKFKVGDIALTNRGSKGVKVANDKPLHIF
jgi:DNA gyrase subunit A